MIVIRDRENDEWAIYINENDSNWEDMLVELLNGQQATISRLEEENEQLKEKLQSVTMLKDDYEELIESFEKKYGKYIEDVIDDE